MTQKDLEVELLSELAFPPERSGPGAIGYDIFAPREVYVSAGEHILIPVDISITLPPGTYGRVAPRSGLALEHFLDVGGGVIDPGYDGKVKVIIYNFSNQPYTFRRGDRIAQLILERAEIVDVKIVIQRRKPGTKHEGFGSTGK